MEEIENYFKEGIVIPSLNAKKSIFIWQNIANEFKFLSKQSKEVVDLYGYIQTSSVSNFILNTTKIYDEPSTKYPTRSIKSFLKKIKENTTNFPEIIEIHETKSILKSYGVTSELIESLNSNDHSSFPVEFHKYYSEKYSTLNNEIENVKFTRDKIIAHNEAIIEVKNVSLKAVEKLIDFSLEIVNVFGIAYYATGYGNQKESLLVYDAQKSASFIISNINNMKAQIGKKDSISAY